MTPAAFYMLLVTNHCVPQKLAPLVVGLAMQEAHVNRLDAQLNEDAFHVNGNGTIDFGINQINSINFGWTGLNSENWRDPCVNGAAALKVLFARYNGNPPDAVKAMYAAGAIGGIEVLSTKLQQITAGEVQPSPVSSSEKEDDRNAPSDESDDDVHDGVHQHPVLPHDIGKSR